MINNLKFIKPLLIILLFLVLFVELIKIPLPHNTKSANKIEPFTNELNNKTRLRIHNNNIKLDKEIEFTKSQIKYLDPNDSSQIFDKNPYLYKMNDINIKARNFSNLEEIITAYKEKSIKKITNEEKEAFFWFLQHLIIRSEKLSPFIYNEIFNKNIIIAKSNSWLENNMPHTHKNVIILNQEWFDEIVIKSKENLVLSALNNEGTTFLHELLHIHQRYNKKKYDLLYHKWGFIKPKYIHNSDTFFNINRSNPDGNDFDWVWCDKKNKKYFMIGAIYNNNPSNILDVSYVSREITKSDKNIFNYSSIKKDVLLLNNNGFNNYFNIYNNHYHPNEITSQYIEFYLNNI